MTKAKVFLIIHTIYGHTYKMAQKIKAGLDMSGVESTIFQVPETLSPESKFN